MAGLFSPGLISLDCTSLKDPNEVNKPDLDFFFHFSPTSSITKLKILILS